MMQSGRKGGECHSCLWNHVLIVMDFKFGAITQFTHALMGTTHHHPCLHFHSWHHVQGHNRLLEEDPQGRGSKSLLQGCLVQRDQRHGWRLCVGAVRRVQEVHIINVLISPFPRKPFALLSLNSCDRVITACGELQCGHVLFCDSRGQVGILDLGYHASSEICIYPIYDVPKSQLRCCDVAKDDIILSSC